MAEGIVLKFLEQRHHAAYLAEREQTVKSQVRKSKLHKRFLEDKLICLQYSGGLSREKLTQQGNALESEIETTGTESDQLRANMDALVALIEHIWNKLKELCTLYDIGSDDMAQLVRKKNRIFNVIYYIKLQKVVSWNTKQGKNCNLDLKLNPIK